MKYMLLFILAAACTAVVIPDGAEPDSCGKAGYANLIGKPLAATTFPDTLNARIIAPDSAVTTDFQTDRLNIFLDETGQITRLSCG